MVMGSFAGGLAGSVIGQAVIEVVVDNSGVNKSLTNTQKMVAGLAVAGFGAAAAAAISFEASLTNVAKTTNLTGSDLQALGQEFRDMASDIPMSASALADIGAMAAQLGVQSDDLTHFTEAIAKLSTATNIVGEQGAQDLARFINVMGESTGNIDRIGSAIVDLGNNSATTEAEILALALRTAAAGRQLGLTTGDVLGLAAAASSLGLEAEAGGTALSRVMLDIYANAQKGSGALALHAQVAGMTAEAYHQMVKSSPMEALNAFIVGLGTAEQRGINVITMLDEMSFGNVRIRDTLLRLSGAQDLMTGAVERGNRAYDENTALEEEFQLFREATINQLKILANQFTELGIVLGGAMVPPLKVVVGLMSDALDVFTALPEPVQAVVLGATGFVAILPALVLYLKQLRTAMLAVNTTLAASPLGIVAVTTALVAGGLAWMHYGNQAQEASEKANRAANVQALASQQSREEIDQEIQRLKQQIAALEERRAELLRNINEGGMFSEQAGQNRRELDALNASLKGAKASLEDNQKAYVNAKSAAELAALGIGTATDATDDAAAAASEYQQALRDLNMELIRATVLSNQYAAEATGDVNAMVEAAERAREDLRRILLTQSGEDSFWEGLLDAAMPSQSGISQRRAEEATRRQREATKDAAAAQKELGKAAKEAAKDAEESARRQQQAADDVARAWETTASDAVRQADTLGSALVSALRRQAQEASDLRIQSMRDAADALLAPLQAQLDALDAGEAEDELARLNRDHAKVMADLDKQLKTAWDPREQEDIRERREKAIEQHADRLADIERRKTRAGLQAQMQDIRDDLARRETEERESLARSTENWRLELQARNLILSGNFEEMARLLEGQEGAWSLAGKSLGDAIVNGLNPPVEAWMAGLASRLAALGVGGGGGGAGTTPASKVADKMLAEIARAKAGGAPGFALEAMRAAFEREFGYAAPLARGGVITEPTFAYIGETAAARPEIVTPQRLMADTFRDVLREAGGAAGGEIVLHNYTVLDGEVIDHRIERFNARGLRDDRFERNYR